MMNHRLMVFGLLMFSMAVDIISFLGLNRLWSLESNPLFLLGFAASAVITIKILVNVLIFWLLVSLPKGSAWQFFWSLMIVYAIFFQIFAAVGNIAAADNVAEHFGQESITQVSDDQIASINIPKEKLLAIYLSRFIVQYLLPIVLAMSAFWLWRKEESQWNVKNAEKRSRRRV